MNRHSPPPVSPQAALLAEAIDRAADGDFAAPLPEGGPPDVVRLAASFAALRQRLAREEKERTKREEERRAAVSGIAHDLRTPLTTIIGFTEALQRRLDRTPERRDAYLAAIALRAQDLSQLIDELSAAGKTGGLPALHPEPVRPAAFLRDWASAHAERLREDRVTLVIDADPELLVPLDRQAFQRILANLLTNAVKYRTRSASEVTLSFYRRGAQAVFTCRDDGPGAPEGALARLFDAGYRASNADGRAGSGLGLSVVAQLVKAHGGSASARNENGLVLTLTFPMTGGLSC